MVRRSGRRGFRLRGTVGPNLSSHSSGSPGRGVTAPVRPAATSGRRPPRSETDEGDGYFIRERFSRGPEEVGADARDRPSRRLGLAVWSGPSKTPDLHHWLHLYLPQGGPVRVVWIATEWRGHRSRGEGFTSQREGGTPERTGWWTQPALRRSQR